MHLRTHRGLQNIGYKFFSYEIYFGAAKAQGNYSASDVATKERDNRNELMFKVTTSLLKIVESQKYPVPLDGRVSDVYHFCMFVTLQQVSLRVKTLEK